MERGKTNLKETKSKIKIKGKIKGKIKEYKNNC
jgi:hypothetical protein